MKIDAGLPCDAYSYPQPVELRGEARYHQVCLSQTFEASKDTSYS